MLSQMVFSFCRLKVNVSTVFVGGRGTEEIKSLKEKTQPEGGFVRVAQDGAVLASCPAKQQQQQLLLPPGLAVDSGSSP